VGATYVLGTSCRRTGRGWFTAASDIIRDYSLRVRTQKHAEGTPDRTRTRTAHRSSSRRLSVGVLYCGSSSYGLGFLNTHIQLSTHLQASEESQPQRTCAVPASGPSRCPPPTSACCHVRAMRRSRGAVYCFRPRSGRAPTRRHVAGTAPRDRLRAGCVR
jgi:hypothetical protein